jgi:hypothetical protein
MWIAVGETHGTGQKLIPALKGPNSDCQINPNLTHQIEFRV